MYSIPNESKLIRTDIVDLLQDYASVQLDIDETRIKAAALVAQDIDIERVVGSEIVNQFIGTYSVEDIPNELKDVYLNILPAWCYFTYSRLLLMFHGSLSDSGFVVEEGAAERNLAKSVSKEHRGVADFYLEKAISFIPESSLSKGTKSQKTTPGIRVFGGKEYRSSN